MILKPVSGRIIFNYWMMGFSVTFKKKKSFIDQQKCFTTETKTIKLGK